jgi:hypothetical protein
VAREGTEPSDRCYLVPSRRVALYRLTRPQTALSGGRGEAPGTGGPPWCWLLGSLVDRSFYGGRLYRDELIQCQSDYDNYTCPHAKVAMSSGDGMGPSTQVLVARHAWVPEVTSHPVSRISYPKLETPKRGFRGPGA